MYLLILYSDNLLKAFLNKHNPIEFASRPGHTKDHHKKWYKLPPCIGTHALGLEFGSAAQLSKRPGSVWNCLWGNALKKSPGIIRKSRVSYPVPGFLSSATWPSLPKKHYNGLNQTIYTTMENFDILDEYNMLQQEMYC